MQQHNIFYHMYCVNDCLSRFQKTYQKIANSGLLNTCNTFYVGLVGPLSNSVKLELEKMHSKIECIQFSVAGGEMETLRFLHKKSYDSPHGVSLYIHSKGVSRGPNPFIESWVDYMEFFCIENYKVCLQSLETNDTVGVNLHHQPMSHYSGNFWWATNLYLQTLLVLDVKNSNNKTINDERWYCEFWLLDSKSVKARSLHQSPINHYCTIYDKSSYNTQQIIP